MAMNKYMHPRNIYKIPPDFCKLSKKCDEFCKISKVDVTGKVKIDFKDPHALRVLTKCLLKADFNLHVDIPEDRLVPTLPLRLNYILWIEDLLASIKKEGVIKGLDIGTGACAIYPLLGAVKNTWHMIGTESDEESLQKAIENVERNNLQDLIELRKNTTASVIEHLFTTDSGLKFDFCMCNPPFYSNIQDVWESRSPARPPPKNGFTGSPQEIITEGGELEFCRKMIKESETYKHNIIIFTTMVGHKYNLKELAMDLKAEGVKFTSTEFCQGRVTRWGLAWTYQDYDLYKLVPPRDKPRKKNVPITIELPELLSEPYKTLENAFDKIKLIFKELDIIHNVVTMSRSDILFNFIASRNTWSNQRRKRRLLKRIEEKDSKKHKSDVNPKTSTNNNEKIELSKEIEIEDICATRNISETIEINSDKNNFKTNIFCNNTSSKDTKGQVVVNGVMKIISRHNKILLEAEFVDGLGGKEALHQILQHIKNVRK